MKYLRTLMARMVVNHILVATLASAGAAMILSIVLVSTVNSLTPNDYRGLAMLSGIGWLFSQPDSQPNPPNLNMPAGFSLLVSPENTVLFSQGDTTCHSGMKLAECAPDLLTTAEGQHFFDVHGQRWAEVIIKTVQGQRAITRRGPPPAEPCISIGALQDCSTPRFILLVSGFIAISALPIALLLGWLSARTIVRRLSNVAKTSRRFASGELSARVNDHHKDEIGQLGQQFDAMAEALEHSVLTLRELAQRNAALMQRAEQSATQAERNRISRDLHDAIAQRLFSLSVSTATLPDLITQDPQQGTEKARIVAALSEQTLLDLRTLLIELRPVNVVQHGLSDALNTICREWETLYHIPIEFSAMLTGKHLPSVVEDSLYRITQEALSNIAKHAHATSVSVSLVEGRRQITLSVTDNGRGFDSAQPGSGKFGLMSMQERAHALGGTMAIESDTTQGTTIRITLPLEQLTGIPA